MVHSGIVDEVPALIISCRSWVSKQKRHSFGNIHGRSTANTNYASRDLGILGFYLCDQLIDIAGFRFVYDAHRQEQIICFQRQLFFQLFAGKNIV